jgi:hypothetical protein
MTKSSKPKKVKPKGTVRELKLVESVSRNGYDILKTEEVKTPKRNSKKAPSTSQQHGSSSPTKRQKLEPFDLEPIPFDLEGPELTNKRPTLVFLLHLFLKQWLTI